MLDAEKNAVAYLNADIKGRYTKLHSNYKAKLGVNNFEEYLKRHPPQAIEAINQNANRFKEIRVIGAEGDNKHAQIYIEFEERNVRSNKPFIRPIKLGLENDLWKIEP